MNRSFRRLGLASFAPLAPLALVIFASGCDVDDSILPDLGANLGMVSRERAPASASPPESAPPPPAAAAAPVAAVVTLVPGTVCTTFPDGITTCTGANTSTTRIAGLF